MEHEEAQLDTATAVAEQPEAEDIRTPGPPPMQRAEAEADALGVVANSPRTATDEEKQSALEWFMADDDEATDPTYPLEVNVSTDPGRPRWITWRIKPVASTRIDYLRRTFTMPVNREQRRKGAMGDLDASKFNAALVFESTVDPDLSIPMGQGKFADGAQLIMHRFRNKPLLIDQIAGQILFYSGGDDDDLRIARDVKAAGN
jgi:hypothetical protein